MTGTEEFLFTLIGLIVYFTIGVGSCKIQEKAKIKGQSVVDVLFWPLILIFAAFFV